MRWPTPQDFNEAIQNPSLCFADQQLARSVVRTNPLGLPQSISGNFASVYKLSCDDEHYAVRCFLSNRKDQGPRYTIIGEQFKQHPLRSSVPFEYLEKGIKVGGSWYPVLKMPWVEGDTLDSYVQNNLLNPKNLTALAQQFFDLVEEMESWQVAHGDLQHGNVIVSQDGLKLIDYDGFYVPGLLGFVSLEIGHPNYQHPKRTEQFFDDTVDNFSCWLIYVSLRCLAIDPSLFHRLEHPEECLIFRKADLAAPEKSPIFRMLLEHESLEIRSLATALSRLLNWAPQLVPPLQVPSAGWSIESATVLTACLILTDKSEEFDQLDEVAGAAGGELECLDEATDVLDLIPERRNDSKRSARLTLLGKNAFWLSSKIARQAKSKIDDVIDRVFSKQHYSLWSSIRCGEADKLFESGDYHEAAEVYRKVYALSDKRSADPNTLLNIIVKLCLCYVRSDQPVMAANFYLLASQVSVGKIKGREADRITHKVMFFSFLASRREKDRSSALSIITELLSLQMKTYKKKSFDAWQREYYQELHDIIDFTDTAMQLMPEPSESDEANYLTMLTSIATLLMTEEYFRTGHGPAKLAVNELLDHALMTLDRFPTQDLTCYMFVCSLKILSGADAASPMISKGVSIFDRESFERGLQMVSKDYGWDKALEVGTILVTSAQSLDAKRLSSSLWRIAVKKVYKDNLAASLGWLAENSQLADVCLDDKVKKSIILDATHKFPGRMDSLEEILVCCSCLGEKGEAIVEATLNQIVEKILAPKSTYDAPIIKYVREWMATFHVPVARWEEFYSEYKRVVDPIECNSEAL